MKILSIESSCDETAAAITEDGRKVLSSVIATQIDEHKLYGGVVPEIASRRHCENITGVCAEALEKADMTLDDVDAVAVTNAPGLIGALLVGVNFAKGLALAKNKPLIAVHHIKGHIAANYITHTELEPPYLCLVVSGGHSHIVKVNSYTELETVGKYDCGGIGPRDFDVFGNFMVVCNENSHNAAVFRLDEKGFIAEKTCDFVCRGVLNCLKAE